uniref:Murine leukemia virus integrase C-terminal domain-containing protein n=1 Tax=Zosterops lateralis melanops TaxID=1220523 RepID=A0A8D2NPX5_ZOSLA
MGLIPSKLNVSQFNLPPQTRYTVEDNRLACLLEAQKNPEEPLKETWTGPHQVLLTTFTAVKVAGVEPWIHYMRVKKVLQGVQLWAVQAVGPTKLRIKCL